jgi:CubicO group peptidase (beta-lactamase class C family)
MKKNKLIKSSVIVIFTLLTSTFVFSQSEHINSQLDQLINKRIKDELFNGSILITKKNKTLYKKSFGYSNIDKAYNINDHSVFKIGSITKQFTAALILKLIEQGRLEIKDDISKYVTEVDYKNKITVEQLLNHTSGIPNYYFFEDYIAFKAEELSTKDMLEKIVIKPLDFAPGTNYKYSNSGYYLLGIIIEKVTGMSYNNAIKALITEPLKLNSTSVSDKHALLVNGYKRFYNKLIPSDAINIMVPYSAGAMISNLEDLLKWHNALFNGFLSKKSLKSMIKPQKENYGYGLWINNTDYGKKIWHTGGIDGFRCIMSYYPEKDIHLIILTNVEGYKIKTLDNDILEILNSVNNE